MSSDSAASPTTTTATEGSMKASGGGAAEPSSTAPVPVTAVDAEAGTAPAAAASGTDVAAAAAPVPASQGTANTASATGTAAGKVKRGGRAGKRKQRHNGGSGPVSNAGGRAKPTTTTALPISPLQVRGGGSAGAPSGALQYTLVPAEPVTPTDQAAKRRGSTSGAGGKTGAATDGTASSKGGSTATNSNSNNNNNGRQRGRQGRGDKGNNRAGGGRGGGAPFRGLPAPVFMPDINTVMMLVRQQTEYYFSEENLVRDTFLRSQMDVDGYVPVGILIAFPRIGGLLADAQLVLSALSASPYLDVDYDNEKLRVRYGWQRWLFPQPDGTRGLPRHVKRKLAFNVGAAEFVPTAAPAAAPSGDSSAATPESAAPAPTAAATATDAETPAAAH